MTEWQQGEVTREAASESNVTNVSSAKVSLHIKYEAYYKLPPKQSDKFVLKCKQCHKSYKFILKSKGNLLKHLQTSHL